MKKNKKVKKFILDEFIKKTKVDRKKYILEEAKKINPSKNE